MINVKDIQLMEIYNRERNKREYNLKMKKYKYNIKI